MFEILDVIIATATVVLGLSLVVLALQQILKQTCNLKARYMRRELLALFNNNVPSNLVRLKRWIPIIGRVEGEVDKAAADIVRDLELKMRTFGFKDLHLLEEVDASKLKELVMALPSAEKSGRMLGKALEDIDLWFDISKRAFQEHYERRMKIWSLTLSALLVVATNANLIAIYNEFKMNKPLRDAVVASAPELLASAEIINNPSIETDSLSDAKRIALIKDNAALLQSLASQHSFELFRWNTGSGDQLRFPGILESTGD